MILRPTSLNRRGESAFTMMEIAIALGVVVFALVAIVGILPTGLNVEKENREATLINEDGPYFLEAIKNGSRGLEILTNYVDSITISETNGGIGQTIIYTNSPGGTGFNPNMTNGHWIIGLLSRPKYWNPTDPSINNQLNNFTNRIEARVHALSGAAVEQGKITREIAFSYSILCELVPINFHAVYKDTNNAFAAERNDLFTQKLQANTYELRLSFRWPLLPNGNVGNGRKIFRTYISGQMIRDPQPDGTILCFFRPQNFAQAK